MEGNTCFRVFLHIRSPMMDILAHIPMATMTKFSGTTFIIKKKS